MDQWLVGPCVAWAWVLLILKVKAQAVIQGQNCAIHDNLTMQCENFKLEDKLIRLSKYRDRELSPFNLAQTEINEFNFNNNKKK